MKRVEMACWKPTEESNKKVSRIRLLVFLIGLAIFVLSLSGKSWGQTALRCGERADILKSLSSLYKETPVAVGIGDNGALLEIIASKNGESWTALSTRSNGQSCVVMSGEQWLIKDQNILQVAK